MTAGFGIGNGARRARRVALACFAAVALCGLAALGGCNGNAIAPPPAATAEVQAQLEATLEDVERMRGNDQRVNAYWAQLWGAQHAARTKAAFKAKAEALVAKAEIEGRAVTPAEIGDLIAEHAQAVADSEAEIGATIEAATEPGFDVAAERIRLALDYVSEITERERALKRARAAFGIRPAPAFNAPKAAPKVSP